MVLDVFDGRLDAVFLDAAGVTRDTFTILKGSLPSDPPSAPTRATASASGTGIAVGWTDTSANEDGFYVERALVGGSFMRIASPGPNATTLIDSGLAPGTTYRYRVQAWNVGGGSAFSNEASATTAATTVASPSALTATARTTTVIDLAWVDNATNETGFEVQRSTDGTSFTTVATLGANSQAYASTGLVKNKLYHYRVRAVRIGTPTVYSTYSNTASARTPKR
jgi:Fibronectin type III domain